MPFPWRTTSTKEVNGKPKNTKRRSSGFLHFNEKGKVKTNGVNGVNGVNGANGSSSDDEPRPGILQRAASTVMPDHSAKRPEVESMLSQFSSVLKASLRPLPNTGDGRYDKSEESHSSLWKDLKTFNITDVKTLREVIQQKASGDLINDKTYMMERIIQLVADLPPESKNRVALTNDFVDQLWNSLQHPPLSYLSNKYIYRQPDGSYNNIQFPHIGQAGLPYARSVRPMVQTQGAYPDAGLIFDSVMARGEYKEHPNKVSSILFYIASIIIHDIFRTDMRDQNISLTSSYLDLAPLYGSSLEEVNLMRTFKDGKIKPDCFSEKRLLGFPPGVGVILIMFNRFHNYVAQQLADINEHGRFSIPPGKEGDEAAQKKRDEDLFQVARLVTSGLYINVILTDYLRTIVNLNRVSSTWTLDPRVNMEKAFGDDGTPRGIGNQISVEFNLVYRWHSCISKRDEKWTEALYSELFPGEDIHNIDIKTLFHGLYKLESMIPDDPVKRNFHKVQRNEDGTLPDDILVDILADSIEDIAGNFGSNVPKILRAVEMLGIEQARKWNCATLNEFRNFFGLKSHNTFEDINRDPKISDALKRLYDHPDFVELYPGLVAEEAKVPMVPGVGICPGFTISRAILSDAVSLVRGDRFYTVDYTPANLTNWGFSEVACDFAINQGCVWNRLCLKAFPNHFKYNSIYAFYPMTIPSENHKIMTELGRVADFDYSRPKRMPTRINIASYPALRTILTNVNFKVTWGENFDFMMKGHTWMLSGDTESNADQRRDMQKAIYGPSNWEKQVFDFYEQKTTELLKKHSYTIAGRQMVDAVRDVINIAHTHFAAALFALPMKTEDHPRGVYTEQELYMILSVMFTFVFFDVEPTKSFALHKAGQMVAGQLAKLIEANVNAINRTSFMKGIVDNIHDNTSALKDYGIHLIRRLLESGKTAEEITWQMVPTASASVSNQAQVFSQILDFYLEEKNAHHLADIQKCAKNGSPEALLKLRHYVLEANRIAGTFGLYRRSDGAFDLQDGDKQYTLKRGDVVFINFITACRDPKVFPDPEEIKLDRPEDSYIQYGDGRHRCLGRDIDIIALTAMLKVFGKLENLRRASGLQGQMKWLPRPGGFKVYMKEDWSSLWPFPTTMKLQYDGKIE